MKTKCRNNNCLRSGEWSNGLCPKCTKLLNRGYASRKKSAKPIKKTSSRSWPKAFKRAKEAFQKLRRLQECDENGFVKCVHGSVRRWNGCDAGHFYPAKYHFTCFVPENVWCQEKHKNMDMDNPATVKDYRDFLLNKIGAEKLAWLESVYKLPIKYSAVELEAMAKAWESECDILYKKIFDKK